MLEVDWDEKNGWHNPVISPFHNFSLSPAATVFHYAIECFEGMKAYKNAKDEILLFRPNKNMERLNNSMTRLALPSILEEDGKANGLMECLKELIKIDEKFIPNKEGYSLYIRPTVIGTSPLLGVHSSSEAKLFVILSPVGPYYKSGFKPVRLLADSKNVRAWPGGVGNAKVGGNYAPTIYPSQLAAKEHGCSQILWLYGPEHQITEVGAMNIFFVLKNGENSIEIVTPTLKRGDILPGVTRDSVLGIARSWKKLDGKDVNVSEREISMVELTKLFDEGKVLEVFGTGTAAVISPVKGIVYKEKEYHVPTGENIGPIAQKFWNDIRDIQYGKIEHEWSIKI